MNLVDEAERVLRVAWDDCGKETGQPLGEGQVVCARPTGHDGPCAATPPVSDFLPVLRPGEALAVDRIFSGARMGAVEIPSAAVVVDPSASARRP